MRTCAILVAIMIAGSAHAQSLSDLTVAEEINAHTYDRDLYDHWIDADDDDLDTRQEVLESEGHIDPTIETKPNGKRHVTVGLWFGLYTGLVTRSPGDLQIDHMVPLKEAHRSGAHAWTEEKRRDYANDLDLEAALIAVKGGSNGSKGAKDPANWMPPNRSFWCRYLKDWIAVKHGRTSLSGPRVRRGAIWT